MSHTRASHLITVTLKGILKQLNNILIAVYIDTRNDAKPV